MSHRTTVLPPALSRPRRRSAGSPRPTARSGSALPPLLRLWRFGFATLALVLFARPRALHAAAMTAVPGVNFEQRIGAALPLTVSVRDEQGHSARLANYFGRQPVVLVFGYSRCPELCAVVANAAVESLRALRQSAGAAYQVVYLSIDPTDTPRDLAAMKRRDVGRYGRTGAAAGWHYLGADEHTIAAVTSAAGFHFTYDPRQKLYAHASGFLVATPDGRVSRYFLGVDFKPADVAAALDRAAAGKTGETVFDLLLVCVRGLGVSGKYGALIWRVLMASSALTVLAVAGGIGWMLRDERRRALAPAPEQEVRS